MLPGTRSPTKHVNKKPRIDCDSFDTMVIVKVGSDRKVFRMHKEILCNVSPFFRRAFEGNFVEGKEQVLELLDERVEMFQHFQLWVYTDTIIAKGGTENDVTWTSLVGLYIFGDMCGIPDLQNMAIDFLIDKQHGSLYIPIELLPQVYRNTPDAAPLRRLFVDFMACDSFAIARWLVEPYRHFYPKSFLFDLAIELNALSFGSTLTNRDFKACRSNYHVKQPPVSPRAAASGAAASKQQ